MKKQFILPEKWCIQGCEELGIYIRSLKKFNRIIHPNGNITNCFYYCNGDIKDIQKWKYTLGNILNKTEITFEQFKKYVLKEKNMFTIDDLANGKCAVINDGTLDELKAVLKKAFPQDFNTSGNYKYYFATMTKTRWSCGDKTSLPTQSVKQFLNMEEKKIIGYKAPYDLCKGNIKKGTTLSQKYEGVWQYLDNPKDSHFTIPDEIVKTWEPVYEPEKPKEEIISMGSFNLKVTKEGIFHKSENIKEFVKYISSVTHSINFGFSSKVYSYDLIVKDIVLSKTGCENTETTVSQWLKVWNKYQEFQK